MKTMKKINVKIIIAAFFFMGVGCTDLEEELQDEFTERITPQNIDFGKSVNVNMSPPVDGLGAAFSTLLNGTANHGSYFSISEISTDEVVIAQKGGDWFDGGIWLNMHRHDFRPTNDGLNGAWNDMFGGITQANSILADVELSAEQEAQLRFLRAYLFWKLTDSFGNIKLVVERGVDVPQSTRPEVIAFVESEINTIIDDLPDGRQDYARVSKSAAYALLSRIYLNSEVYTGVERYQDAIDAADMVINSGVYELADNYGDVFSPINVENIEQIFIVPFDEATGTGMNFAQMTLHYPSQLTFRLQSQPWNGYATLEEFYNSYEDGDERKANNFIVGPQVDLNGDPILDVAFDAGDEDGAAINYTPAINELAPNSTRQAGARMGKYSFKIGQLNDADNDYVLLRYGEVIMNKAEAIARRDGFGSGEALALVNQLRARAGVADLASLTEEEFLAERGREFFQESLRRMDLIRFGAWGNAWWEKGAHSNADLNIFPIPTDQINASLSEQFPLIQNPGY